MALKIFSIWLFFTILTTRMLSKNYVASLPLSQTTLLRICSPQSKRRDPFNSQPHPLSLPLKTQQWPPSPFRRKLEVPSMVLKGFLKSCDYDLVSSSSPTLPYMAQLKLFPVQCLHSLLLLPEIILFSREAAPFLHIPQNSTPPSVFPGHPPCVTTPYPSLNSLFFSLLYVIKPHSTTWHY